jgi:hypothetical protein
MPQGRCVVSVLTLPYRPVWKTDFDPGFLFYLLHEVPHRDCRSRCGHAGSEGVVEVVVGGDAPTDSGTR